MSNQNDRQRVSPRTGGEEIVVERSFVVDGSPDQAWDRLVQLSARHDQAAGSWWLPGFRSRAIEIAATAGHRLEVVKAEEPCRHTTIVLTFEHVGTGTRIHVTQSGFDPTFVEMAGENFWAHGAVLLDGVEEFFRGRAASPTSG